MFFLEGFMVELLKRLRTIEIVRFDNGKAREHYDRYSLRPKEARDIRDGVRIRNFLQRCNESLIVR
jgi:hypothetical protein